MMAFFIFFWHISVQKYLDNITEVTQYATYATQLHYIEDNAVWLGKCPFIFLIVKTR